MRYLLLFCLIILIFVSCTQQELSLESENELFTILNADSTGLHFTNQVLESAEYNYLTYEGMYQGAGVGIGDFNSDGLDDIFFAGNSNSDQLFINQGSMKFLDYSKQAGIIQDDSWSTGVAVVDVNNDNLLDIYVCKFLYEDPQKRKNLLYINKGAAQFVEASSQFGLVDLGYSIHSTFFDYDRDGDLDVYVVNQPPTKNAIRYQLGSTRDLRYTSKLYENQGDYGFKDVTDEAGLANFGYSLHAMAADYNDDGWMDLYVTNDFEEADFFYVNQGDGTFRDEIASSMRHISNFSMGADAADVNNDGQLDLVVADMTSSDPYRQKTNMASMNPAKFEKMISDFGIPQYMNNTLQINRGNKQFSETAFQSGVAYSDWSWAPLMADFDNDSDKDLIISNGILKDVINKDILDNRRVIQNKYRDSIAQLPGKHPTIEQFLLSKMPSNALPNPYFENTGEAIFIKRNERAFSQNKTWTQGMAYGDLDNDGDLDLVYNNTRHNAQILRNNTNTQEYIDVRLQSKNAKHCPIGSKIYVHHGDTTQMLSLNPVRGYQSSCSCKALFGVPGRTKIDSLVIIWPDNMRTRINKLKTGQSYNIKQSKRDQKLSVKKLSPNYSIIDLENHGIQKSFDDYKDERLLPYKLSEWGRKVSKNRDGSLVFIPGTEGYRSAIWKWENGKLKEFDTQVFDSHIACEDIIGVFADIDNDGDEDLLVATGAYEIGLEAACSRTRLYVNKGSDWILNSDFPEIRNHASSLLAMDFDQNGYTDFLLSSRSIPGKYGTNPQHFLLMNRGKEGFVIREDDRLDALGMITDLQSVDLENDGENEIIVSSEWGKISILKIEDDNIVLLDEKFNFQSGNGLWNSVFAYDFDSDGDVDIMAGNVGANTKYTASVENPMSLYSGDLDANGSADIYLSYKHDGIELPVRGRQCSSEELPSIKTNFTSYSSFADADITKIINVSNGRKKSIDELKSCIFWNDDGKFLKEELTSMFQLSMLRSCVYANDQFLFAGNMNHWEAESSRTDAMIPFMGKITSAVKWNLSSDSPIYEIGGEISDMISLSSKTVLVLRNNDTDILLTFD